MRHEVVWMAVSTVKCYETCYSTNSTLPGYAIAVTRWCKAPGTTNPQQKAGIQIVRNGCFCQYQTDKVSGSSSMVNICELLLNVVKLNKPKMLTGLNQKVRSWTASSCIVVVDIKLPAERGNLLRFVSLKRVVIPGDKE